MSQLSTPKHARGSRVGNNMSKNKVNMDVVLVFDVETTGKAKDFNAPVTDTRNWPKVVQLGMALQMPDGTVTTWQSLIKPPNGVAFPIPAEATAIHGITDAMCVEKGITIEEALEAFEFWLNGCDALVAHNIAFDRPVLGCEFVRIGRKPVVSPKMRRVCTMKSTTDYCAIQGRYGNKWPSLQELHGHLFGVGFEGAHDALTDVLATLKCYNELTTRGTFTAMDEFLPTQPSKQ